MEQHAATTPGAHSGQRATIAAFLANLGIAAAKFVAFAVTGAASMLAEGVHSVADTGNQGLLLWGRRRANQEPNEQHPFGFGRERYFWAFVVALVLFSAGGIFALVEGEEKLRKPHELTSYPWAAGVLLIALVLESLSLRTAVREARPSKRDDESWLDFVRRAKAPELTVVLLEDTGALLGLCLALIGITLAEVTGNSRYDALGSVGIGILLVVIALTLASEMKSLLIGEAAAPEESRAVCDALTATAGVRAVADMRTEQLGPGEILVVATIEIEPGADIPTTVAEAEEAIRSKVPEARLIYLEPRAYSFD